MPVTNTDAVLWYKVGQFGDVGYAVPNFSNDFGSLNPQIIKWVNLVGRNLFHIMHHEDVDLRTPPSINTIRRVHKLYMRAGQLLAANAVPPGENNLEAFHSRPAGEEFRVYPVPYFKVRSPFMREWAGLILISLAEAMQHTENRKEMEISTAFAGQVGQYVQRVYYRVATELFGKTRDEASAEGFRLTDEELAAYDPSQYFTSTEMVDTVPRLDRVFTEDRLELLAEGIPISHLPADLRPWPTNLTELYAGIRGDTSIVSRDATAPGTASSGPVIPPAPSP